MQPTIDKLKAEFSADLAKAAGVGDVENLRIKYLGKKGPVQQLMQLLREIPSEERPEAGKYINILKEEIAARLDTAAESVVVQEESSRLAKEKIDVTMPGRRHNQGRKHIISQTMDEIIEILSGMGFSVQYGPDIETDYYNFEALNINQDHPARDMQDTFYITDKHLLRTHTSNVQVRVMETSKPPIRIIAPGKVYRNEDVSARSHVFFHQVEGLYIDKGVTFADLLATMEEFYSKLFKTQVEARFRPSYFPFVEPGVEVDIRCVSCNGAGCNLCKYSGWLEVAGAGMVHPEVLRNGDIDPEEYSGYAWGMGLERMIMLKHGIKDIRYFTENDMRFVSQFPGV